MIRLNDLVGEAIAKMLIRSCLSDEALYVDFSGGITKSKSCKEILKHGRDASYISHSTTLLLLHSDVMHSYISTE